MTDALHHFPPTRTEALTRLSRFVPHAGRSYAQRRNYDLGAGQHTAVSTLSPYIRTRLITETEVLDAVLGRHSLQAAEKFVQEVFWRTYWKGWLELRPGVWAQYRHDLRRRLDDVQTQSGLRATWEAACKGDTDIACFNAWAQELARTGYLHNHARMWFASIWIFTLKLPWELGADFFLRHLLDGDPASNTLSWRWVAGLQTQGKTYLARTSNIAKFTEGRFAPKWQLAGEAPALPFVAPPEPRILPTLPAPDPNLRTGMILHCDDLSIGGAVEGLAIQSHVALDALSGLSPLNVAPHLPAFQHGCLADTQHRWADRLGANGGVVTDITGLRHWVATQNLEQIVTPYAPVGPVAEMLSSLADDPSIPPLVQVRRASDEAAWPKATKGFFPFKSNIPALLSAQGKAA